MNRRDKNVLILAAILLAFAVFALVVGGFLWPRPQFQRGPWESPPVEPAPDGLPAAFEGAP